MCRLAPDLWTASIILTHRCSWNPEGVLLGKFAVANGGVNNFAFVQGGLCMCNITACECHSC